jgi:hypothetical protein
LKFGLCIFSLRIPPPEHFQLARDNGICVGMVRVATIKMGIFLNFAIFVRIGGKRHSRSYVLLTLYEKSEKARKKLDGSTSVCSSSTENRQSVSLTI